MYRFFIMTLVLALTAGCANSPTRSPSAGQDNSPAFAEDRECDATGVQSYIGQHWRDGLEADLRRASSSQTLRLLRPGQVMTMDLNPYRLNALIDAQGVIESLYCS